MSPEDRRAAILEVARPLVIEHGTATTTKMIAEAAGIAEGTIFRVFSSKDEIFDALIDAVFNDDQFMAEVRRLDAARPLRDRLVALTSLHQGRFIEIFAVMTALGVRKPPERHQSHRRIEQANEYRQLAVALIGDDADVLTVDPGQAVHLLGLLTFSGSHPHISDQHILTPEQIVDTILHGILRKDL